MATWACAACQVSGLQSCIHRPAPCHADQACDAFSVNFVVWPGAATTVPYCDAHAQELLAANQAVQDQIQAGLDRIAGSAFPHDTAVALVPQPRAAVPAFGQAPPCHGPTCQAPATELRRWRGQDAPLPYCARCGRDLATAEAQFRARVAAGLARVAAPAFQQAHAERVSAYQATLNEAV